MPSRDTTPRHSPPPRSSSTSALMRSRQPGSASSQASSSTTNLVRSQTPPPTSSILSPPSYAHSSLDRSPATNLMELETAHRVPVPIYLRPSSPQAASSKGQLKIHVPAWGVVFVRPPKQDELHPLDGGSSRQPPSNDTALTGSLEVIMKERRKAHSISVGVQSVCRLHMGVQRGWEEDGIFERGVEILGGTEDGIWLEKGSQNFTFAILLPATLATHDKHQFGRVSYILTARVEGAPATWSLGAMWKSKESTLDNDIEFKTDFEAVIARSDKLAHELQSSPKMEPRRTSSSPSGLSPQVRALGLNLSPTDESAIALGEGSPSLDGLYIRRPSTDLERVPSLNLAGGSPLVNQRERRDSVGSSHSTVKSPGNKDEWLKGDLHASRSLIVHANPNPTGGVTQLDVRKAGAAEGLGPWRFAFSSDVFTISGVVLISMHMPNPSPDATIFYTRVLLVQNYTIVSPRNPNDTPHRPEAARNHVLYQVGRPHKAHEKFPGHELDCLWRGPGAGGSGICDGEEGGWKTKAVARLPSHDKIRPSTNEGTITPIRVTHDLVWQVFYSIEGRKVNEAPVTGPGELRMMAVKIPINVPSCCNTTNALDLPTYERAGEGPAPDIDAIISSRPSSKYCQCGYTFAELGEAAMRRMQAQEQEEAEEELRDRACGAVDEAGERKIEMERRGSGGVNRH